MEKMSQMPEQFHDPVVTVSPHWCCIPFAGFSMYPFIRPYDRLVVKLRPISSLGLGDVVVVASESAGTYCHRVVGLKKGPLNEILTKGDSVLNPDPLLAKAENIIGRVEFLVRDGRFIPLAKGFRGRSQKILTSTTFSKGPSSVNDLQIQIRECSSERNSLTLKWTPTSGGTPMTRR